MATRTVSGCVGVVAVVKRVLAEFRSSVIEYNSHKAEIIHLTAFTISRVFI